MATLTDEDIEGRILLMNLTSRKVLGGLTPLEVFTGRRVELIPCIQQRHTKNNATINEFT